MQMLNRPITDVAQTDERTERERGRESDAYERCARSTGRGRE